MVQVGWFQDFGW